MTVAIALAAEKGSRALHRVDGIKGVRSILQSSPDEVSEAVGEKISALFISRGLLGPETFHAKSVSNAFGKLAAVLSERHPPEACERDLQNQFSTSAAVIDDQAEPILRAMIQMARADGSFSCEEKQTFMKVLGFADGKQKSVLWSALRDPVDPEMLCANVPTHSRKEVYAAALLIGEPTKPSDLDYLECLAKHLKLSQHELDSLHDVIGKKGFTLP